MPSDYKGITKDNIRRRGDEFDDIGEFIAEQLYSDRTHFLYELLQNCDDAIRRRAQRDVRRDLSRSITFHLFRDRLEVRHFGKPFDEPDVRGISDVLKGTKRNDPTQIGRFGIGFKSVYALTSSPEVHSGDEHFRIERYIRPCPAEARPLADGETLFILPFNHKSVSPDEAFHEIGDKLQSIGPHTLLFVRHLEQIAWAVEGGPSGSYCRHCKREGPARRAMLTSGGSIEDEEEWVVFERPLSWKSRALQRVEVAYHLAGHKEPGAGTVDSANRYPLAVFFPTIIATGLAFQIQGPYVPTADREKIRTSGADGEWNRGLVHETAALVAETLPILRGMGLLTVGLLEAMPIDPSDFREGGMFRPIFDRVRETLREHELLPAQGGGFVAGRRAKLAEESDLRELLSGQELQNLFGEDAEVKWVSGDVVGDLRGYLVSDLDVEEITWDKLARRLDAAFIEERTDEWVTRFYGLLNKRSNLWRPPRGSWESGGPLRDKPFIRLEDGSHVAPFREDRSPDRRSPNAYLPPSDETDYPIVKRRIVADEAAHDFLLNSLGLKPPNNVTEVIERVLPKYHNPQDAEKISTDEHARDIEKVTRALKTAAHDERNTLEKRLKETPFLRATHVATAKTVFIRPSAIYARSDELEVYFEGNVNAYFLADEYSDDHVKTFCELGVSRTVRVRCRQRRSEGYVVIADDWGRHERGLHGFDPHAEIDGIDHALRNPSIERAAYVWNELLIPNRHLLRGTVESSGRQTFENPTREEKQSKLGKLVCGLRWLPAKSGIFQKPAELSLDDLLPDDFARDAGLASALGMRPVALEARAREAGMALVPLAEYQEFKSWQARRSSPDFPVREPRNPDLRSERVSEEAANAPDKAYEQRPRSVRTSDDVQRDAKTCLREQYTNDQGEMLCQICRNEMPFKLDDGRYYFEAVECVEAREHRQNHLALCPICAAKYRHANGSSSAQIREAVLQANGLQVPVILAGELHTIRFVEIHLRDLQVVLHRDSTPRETEVSMMHRYDQEA